MMESKPAIESKLANSVTGSSTLAPISGSPGLKDEKLKNRSTSRVWSALLVLERRARVVSLGGAARRRTLPRSRSMTRRINLVLALLLLMTGTLRAAEKIPFRIRAVSMIAQPAELAPPPRPLPEPPPRPAPEYSGAVGVTLLDVLRLAPVARGARLEAVVQPGPDVSQDRGGGGGRSGRGCDDFGAT